MRKKEKEKERGIEGRERERERDRESTSRTRYADTATTVPERCRTANARRKLAPTQDERQPLYTNAAFKAHMNNE